MSTWATYPDGSDKPLYEQTGILFQPCARAVRYAIRIVSTIEVACTSSYPTRLKSAALPALASYL